MPNNGTAAATRSLPRFTAQIVHQLVRCHAAVPRLNLQQVRLLRRGIGVDYVVEGCRINLKKSAVKDHNAQSRHHPMCRLPRGPGELPGGHRLKDSSTHTSIHPAFWTRHRVLLPIKMITIEGDWHRKERADNLSDVDESNLAQIELVYIGVDDRNRYKQQVQHFPCRGLIRRWTL